MRAGNPIPGGPFLVAMQDYDHLVAADPKLGALMQEIGPLEPWAPVYENNFIALSRAIVSQQLSTTVARAIWKKIADRYGEVPDPQLIAAATDEELREVGLSRQKAGYMRSLATHVLDDTLGLNEAHELSDEDVLKAVTAVKGLGVWTAHMFMMFHLGRPDILAVGDLGIKEGFKRLYELEERPSPAEMEELAKAWRPYRTLACRYLWRSLEMKPT